MRRLIPFALLGVFFALLIPRLTQSFAQGDVYPEWSTLRSDPLGSKVLFLALSRMPGVTVERNFAPWKEQAARRAQYVFLGVGPAVVPELEKLLAGGGTVLAGLPSGRAKALPKTEKLGFVYVAPGEVELRTEAWQCEAGTRERCRVLRKGGLVVMADGAPLRNGELHEKREAELVAKLFGAGLPVVFDESHLGVTETGGVGVLLRRYRLFPAIGMMLAAALLFLWRSGVSLLPEREPLSAGMTPQPAASLRTLLAQRVGPAKVLETLVSEWRRALPLLPSWQRGREAEMEAALERARGMKDLRQGYAELRAAVEPRKGSA